MDGRGDDAGTASAVLGVLQSTIDVLAVGAVGLLADGTPLPMALVMLGCGAVALLLARLQLERTDPRDGAHSSEHVHRTSPGSSTAPPCTGSPACSHSAQPVFISFAKNPCSANCRAALAPRCQ
jgi:hypothetical protein